MASPAPLATATEAAPSQTPHVDLDNQELEADDADSAYGESILSDTTSVASVIKGYYENGRRYQNLRDIDYYQPVDDIQWETMAAAHMLWKIMDSQRANVLFQSPISAKAQHIMDLGTGSGEWALDVADKYPSITVHGVDLYPAPQPWTAPNCVFEVDDVSKPWTWNHKFDLVHLRIMVGAFSDRDWRTVYRRIYDNLEPGGWIEQLDPDTENYCDDGTLPADSILRYGEMLNNISRAERSVETAKHMESRIKEAGFVNIHKTEYKVPLGAWPKLQVYKDAGRVNLKQYMIGMEGWCLYLLTKSGLPKPWSMEEAQVWLAKVRQELNAGYHIYQKYTRVWAQKPYDAEPKAEVEVEVENVAERSPSPAPPAKKKLKTEGKEAKNA